MPGRSRSGWRFRSNLFPSFFCPVCVFALGRRAMVLLLSLGIPALLSLPYGFPRVPIWKSLGQFVYVARVNDMFWWLVEETFWPNPHQKNYHYNVIIMIAVAIVSMFFIRQWKRGMLWAMGTALILSPVLHPWYCTWILPFAAWRRNDAWQVFRSRFSPTISSGTNGFSCCRGIPSRGCAVSFSFRRSWPRFFPSGAMRRRSRRSRDR